MEIHNRSTLTQSHPVKVKKERNRALMGRAPEPRIPTLEKRPVYMIGTINFMGFCFVFFTLNELVSSYYHNGYFVDFTLFKSLTEKIHIALFLWFLMLVVTIIIWEITRVTINRKIPKIIGFALFITALSALLTGPIIVSFKQNFSPLMAGATSIQCIVYSMKMYSYWSTNWMIENKWNIIQKEDKKAMSDEDKKSKKESSRKRLSFKNFVNYMLYPTLVFEEKWPLNDKIRWGYAFSLFIQIWVTFFIIYVILNNYLVPIYNTILINNIIYSILQMSLPSVAIWMLGFYNVFHCILGLYAELTRFADREFYLDWWNAENFEVWWRQWNRPVHRWMSRHVYSESIQRGQFGRGTAFFLTFLTSAVLHEVVLTTAFKKLRPVMSSLMIFQIVVIKVSKIKALEHTSFGNIVMWLTMFAGFPICQALYAIGFSI